MKKVIIFFIFAFTFLAITDQAGAFIISSTERGTYNEIGVFGTAASGTESGNYLTGSIFDQEYSSFSNFDLTSIAGNITSTTLIISQEEYCESPDMGETLCIFDYNSNISSPFLNLNGTIETVPESPTMLLLGTALVGIVAVSRRRNIK